MRLVYRALLAATECVCSSLASDWEFLSVILSHVSRLMFSSFSDSFSITKVIEGRIVRVENHEK